MASEEATRRLMLCRPGFEPDLANEVLAHTGAEAIDSGAGWVVAPAAAERIPFRDWIFARDAFTGRAFELQQIQDRVTPLVELARALPPCGTLWMQHVDTEEGRSVGRLCTRLEARMTAALREAGALRARADRRLHVLFLSGRHGWIGVSDPAQGACWSMGIPRLRLPGAPSRSAAKLEEALLWFLGEDAPALLRTGMSAVDLGAAPGGWSWLLARRGLKVSAIDHAQLRREALEAGAVRHLRADAFTWLPPRAVDWLVCDVVDKPARVADLVGRWFAQGRCRNAIFNLKLPMKQRAREVSLLLQRLRERLASLPRGVHCEARQLYHDREEITVCIRVHA